jgi:hypothetical protein
VNGCPLGQQPGSVDYPSPEMTTAGLAARIPLQAHNLARLLDPASRGQGASVAPCPHMTAARRDLPRPPELRGESRGRAEGC